MQALHVHFTFSFIFWFFPLFLWGGGFCILVVGFGCGFLYNGWGFSGLCTTGCGLVVVFIQRVGVFFLGGFLFRGFLFRGF